MEMFKSLFKRRSGKRNTNGTLNNIRKNLAEYTFKHVSIIECVSKTAPLTTELILLDSSSKKERSDVYDSILIMVSNYYMMLHMDMYTGFYAVNRKHTSGLVGSLADDALKVASENQRGLKAINHEAATQKSLDFAKQIVEVYYTSGTEGCQRYIASSIYSVLVSSNNDRSVKSDRIEFIVRSIRADKYLSGNYDNEELALYNTG